MILIKQIGIYLKREETEDNINYIGTYDVLLSIKLF